MRLTNQMREDFVNAVMKKVRRRQKWSREAVVEEINKRLRDVLPIEVADFRKKYPNLVATQTLCIDWLGYRDSDNYFRWVYAGAVVDQKLSDIIIEDLKKNYELWQKEEERRKEMAGRLRQVAFSVTTNTDLAIALPDLIKFVPKDEPKVKKQLPVANSQLFKDLKSLGLEVEK
jgi:hypothetical protein